MRKRYVIETRMRPDGWQILGGSQSPYADHGVVTRYNLPTDDKSGEKCPGHSLALFLLLIYLCASDHIKPS